MKAKKNIPTPFTNASTPDLNHLTGNQTQQGHQKLKCPHCKTKMNPLLSLNGNTHCSTCEALLYKGNQQNHPNHHTTKETNKTTHKH
jgi:uncharacterized Zn finger protein (UPF0148 family)